MDRKPVTVRSTQILPLSNIGERKKEKKWFLGDQQHFSDFRKTCTQRRPCRLLPTDARLLMPLYQWSASEWGWACQDEQIINRYRPEGEGFVRIDTQNNMPTAAGLSSSSSGLSALVKACNAISSLVWIGASWRRRLSLPQGRPLAVLRDCQGAGDKDITPCRDRLETSYDYVGAGDKKNQFLAVMGWNPVWKPDDLDDWVSASLRRIIRDAGLSQREWLCQGCELTEKMP